MIENQHMYLDKLPTKFGNYLFSFTSLILFAVIQGRRLVGRLQADSAEAGQNVATAASSNTTATKYIGSSTVDG